MYFKTAAILEKSIMGAQSCLPCNVFFLSPSCGAGSLVYMIYDRICLFLFCRTKLGVAVPCKQRFFRFVAINLLYIEAIQVMVAQLFSDFLIKNY